MSEESIENPRIIPAKSSRFAAMQLDMGNIICMLLPPLPLLWFGGAILIYALNRHHPHQLVGKYTQSATYRFYAVMGAIIPIGTFFPGDAKTAWLIAWGLGIAIIVPWSLWAIRNARAENWEDIELPLEESEE